MLTHCVRLTEPQHADTVVAVGALQFTKGFSGPMSEADARVHCEIVSAVHAAEVVPRPVQAAAPEVSGPTTSRRATSREQG